MIFLFLIVAQWFCFSLYFTRVQLGSPSQEFYVQIDSGSDVLWIGCNSCSGCPTSSGLKVILFCFINFLSKTLFCCYNSQLWAFFPYCRSLLTSSILRALQQLHRFLVQIKDAPQDFNLQILSVLLMGIISAVIHFSMETGAGPLVIMCQT